MLLLLLFDQSNTAVYHINYHIRLSFFDALYRRFVGQTWSSHEVATSRSEMVTQPAKIHFKQVGNQALSDL